jgi:hypothetical protein
MKLASVNKVLEKRDRWSIAVYRYDQADSLFSSPPAEQIYFVGERGLRLGKSYQSVAADPFLFTFGEKLYLFYEVKTDHGHGTVHAQSMSHDGVWTDHGTVLTEPFHLSYPQVFEVDGQIFMIPEAAQSGTVTLYKAEDFPYCWRACAVLIHSPLRDPTLLVTHGEGFFLLATTAEYELKLYHSKAIDRPFSDTGVVVTKDRSRARCAGGIFKMGGRLIRPTQDCSKVYGERIHFQDITTISSSVYIERPLGLNLHIPGATWMSRGSHHISVNKFGNSFFVAVDGRGADSLFNSVALGILRLGSVFSQKIDMS